MPVSRLMSAAQEKDEAREPAGAARRRAGAPGVAGPGWQGRTSAGRMEQACRDAPVGDHCHHRRDPRVVCAVSRAITLRLTVGVVRHIVPL